VNTVWNNFVGENLFGCWLCYISGAAADGAEMIIFSLSSSTQAVTHNRQDHRTESTGISQQDAHMKKSPYRLLTENTDITSIRSSRPRIYPMISYIYLLVEGTRPPVEFFLFKVDVGMTYIDW